MEKPIISKTIREEILKYRPTVKNWYVEDRSSILIQDRIKGYTLPDDLIKEFIETEIVYDEFYKRYKNNKYVNLNGFSLYYFNLCLSLITDYYSFEYLKRIFERFIQIEKECYEIRKIRMGMIDDKIYDDESFNIFSKFADFIKINCSNEEIAEFEKMIDENYFYFLEYEFYDYKIADEQNSDLYFDLQLQTKFPFSENFIKKYYEYFKIELILKNPSVRDNIDMQRFVFKNILKSNLQKHLTYYTYNSETRDFIIDDDMADGLVLKYNLR